MKQEDADTIRKGILLLVWRMAVTSGTPKEAAERRKYFEDRYGNAQDAYNVWLREYEMREAQRDG